MAFFSLRLRSATVYTGSVQVVCFLLQSLPDRRGHSDVGRTGFLKEWRLSQWSNREWGVAERCRIRIERRRTGDVPSPEMIEDQRPNRYDREERVGAAEGSASEDTLLRHANRNQKRNVSASRCDGNDGPAGLHWKTVAMPRPDGVKVLCGNCKRNVSLPMRAMASYAPRQPCQFAGLPDQAASPHSNA